MLKRLLFLIFALMSSALSFGQSDEEKVYTNLAEAIQNPDKVYKLELVKKRLTAFPIEVFRFKNLKSLNLSSNRLLAIPSDIEKLTQLEELDLSRNEIKEIPAEIGSLTNLRQLILFKNEIDTISPEIGNLNKLEKLDLWENEISNIPDDIGKLKNLKILELRGILFSDKQQEHIRELLPETTIFFSPGCGTCKE
jgi:Leucine-rich repeat (LRR) protein